MPQLPSTQFYINSEETDINSPASEAFFQKLGQSINFLNDLFKQVNLITANGTFTVPSGVQRLWIFGAGGGGGGTGFAGSVGGGGGSGAIPYMVPFKVSPGEEYTINIGGGGGGGAGAGNGGSGGDTSFINNVTGKGHVFYGAMGAQFGPGDLFDLSLSSYPMTQIWAPEQSNSSPGTTFNGGLGIKRVSSPDLLGIPGQSWPKWSEFHYYTLGGKGDSNDNGNTMPGQNSPYGFGGSGFGAQDTGGGGGAGFGDGGNGSNGTGQSAAANSSAGGGGGITAGGNGGSGVLFILF